MHNYNYASTRHNYMLVSLLSVPETTVHNVGIRMYKLIELCGCIGTIVKR